MTFTDPIALFRAAVDAVDREDWRGAASLCDPGALAEQFRHLRESYGPSTSAYELTPEMLMQSSPTMPREVAEYQAAQHQLLSDGARRMRHELPTVPDFDALMRLTPVEAYAAHLEGRSARRFIDRLREAGQISEAAATRSLAAARCRHVALGAVPDGEKVTHVVYREESDETEEIDPHSLEHGDEFARLDPAEREMIADVIGRSHARTIACRRQPDGGWLLLAGHDFIGLHPPEILADDE